MCKLYEKTKKKNTFLLTLRFSVSCVSRVEIRQAAKKVTAKFKRLVLAKSLEALKQLEVLHTLVLVQRSRQHSD